MPVVVTSVLEDGVTVPKATVATVAVQVIAWLLIGKQQIPTSKIRTLNHIMLAPYWQVDGPICGVSRAALG